MHEPLVNDIGKRGFNGVDLFIIGFRLVIREGEEGEGARVGGEGAGRE